APEPERGPHPSGRGPRSWAPEPLAGDEQRDAAREQRERVHGGALDGQPGLTRRWPLADRGGALNDHERRDESREQHAFREYQQPHAEPSVLGERTAGWGGAPPTMDG